VLWQELSMLSSPDKEEAKWMLAKFQQENPTLEARLTQKPKGWRSSALEHGENKENYEAPRDLVDEFWEAEYSKAKVKGYSKTRDEFEQDVLDAYRRQGFKPCLDGWQLDPEDEIGLWEGIPFFEDG
jgi:hypothetical protein